MIYVVIFGLSVIAGSLLREFWWGVAAGLIIDLVLFLLLKYGPLLMAWRKERQASKAEAKSASTTTAAAGTTSATKTDPSGLGEVVWKAMRWVLLLVIISWSSWSWYSIVNEVGFPGTYVANKSYNRGFDVHVENLKPQQVCGIRPGTWQFATPDDDKLYYSNRASERSKAGFWVRWGENGEYRTQMILQKDLRVNGTARGDTVTVDESGCVTISWLVTDKRKIEAVSLGSPMLVERVDRGLKEVWGPAPTAQEFNFSLRFSR